MKIYFKMNSKEIARVHEILDRLNIAAHVKDSIRNMLIGGKTGVNTFVSIPDSDCGDLLSAIKNDPEITDLAKKFLVSRKIRFSIKYDEVNAFFEALSRTHLDGEIVEIHKQYVNNSIKASRDAMPENMNEVHRINIGGVYVLPAAYVDELYQIIHNHDDFPGIDEVSKIYMNTWIEHLKHSEKSA